MRIWLLRATLLAAFAACASLAAPDEDSAAEAAAALPPRAERGAAQLARLSHSSRACAQRAATMESIAEPRAVGAVKVRENTRTKLESPFCGASFRARRSCMPVPKKRRYSPPCASY